MTTKTYDWTTMTLAQLVETYNEMVLSAIDVTEDSRSYRPVSKFRDLATGQKRCAAMHSTLDALYAGVEAEARRRPETSVPPGFARLQEHPDAENIRQRTLAEQEAAAAAVARTQEDREMPKKTKTKTDKKTSGRGVDTSQRIVVAAMYKEANPKRGSAAKRFEHYHDNMTVADYIAKIKDRGLALADIRWDVKQGFIRLLKPV